MSVVTHARTYSPPTPIDTAFTFLAKWLQSRSLVLRAEGEGYFTWFSRLALGAKLAGPKIHGVGFGLSARI